MTTEQQAEKYASSHWDKEYHLDKWTSCVLSFLAGASSVEVGAIATLDKIKHMSHDNGRAGCTYGDTDYDSLSVCYGYNLALENVQSIISESTSSSETLGDDAVKFMEWLVSNEYELTMRDDVYSWRMNAGNTTHTTKQLYQLFKQRK